MISKKIPHIRFLILVSIVLLLLVGLAACSSQATPEEPKEVATEAPAAEVTEAPVAEVTEEQAPKGKIVISNWDAYMPEDLLENFTNE